MKFKRMLFLCIAVMMLLGCALTVSAADTSQYEGKIVCAGNRTAVINKNGDLYMWGNNEYGQVGNGTTKTQYSPVKILSNVESIKMASDYSAAITKDGSLYMWGYNTYGRFGTGNFSNYEFSPVKIMSNVASVYFLDDYSTAAVTKGGDLYMWGYGPLGDGSTNSSYVPVKVMSNVSKFYHKKDYIYDCNFAAITKGGDLYMWGDNECGQIGNGTTDTQLKPVKVLSGVVSAAVEGNSKNGYSAAVTKDGSLYMWGYNYYGQVGNGTTTLLDEHKPVKVLSNVKSVYLYGGSTMALQKDGSLYSWGNNVDGRLGNGTSADDRCVSPKKVLSGVKKIEVSSSHCAAITQNGDLYTWGYTLYTGKYHDYVYGSVISPMKLLQNVKDVSIKEHNGGMALTENGTLYAWGDNEENSFGTGYSGFHYNARKVLGEVAYAELSGTTHNAAVTEDGSLYLWGYNYYGQVGNGTRADQPVPVKIMDKAFAAQSSTAYGVERIAGSNRYQTSYKIASSLKSKQGVQKFDTVIIADGRNFPDALAGSYLAKVKNAPILMANEKNAESLQTYVKTNLKSGGMIYVLGGESAVPQSILDGFSGYSVKRLQGNNRYATNLMILEEAGVTDEEILVCTGNGFADSLSASATGKPILLVKNKNFTEEQIQFLEAHRGNDYYIIGGEGAVSAEQMAEIDKYGYVERIAGDSRYETSVKVAEEFFEKPETVVLAYGKNFPDGLCGGPLAMSFDAPLILAATKTIAPAEDYVDANYITTGKVLGGDSLISNTAVNKIF